VSPTSIVNPVALVEIKIKSEEGSVVQALAGVAVVTEVKAVTEPGLVAKAMIEEAKDGRNAMRAIGRLKTESTMEGVEAEVKGETGAEVEIEGEIEKKDAARTSKGRGGE